MESIHGQAKKVTWGVSSQGAMSKICWPPSVARKFFTWGASSQGTFAIFKLSAPILGGGRDPFYPGECPFLTIFTSGVAGWGQKNFVGAAAPPSLGGSPHPILSFRESTKIYPGVHPNPLPPFAHVWSRPTSTHQKRNILRVIKLRLEPQVS